VALDALRGVVGRLAVAQRDDVGGFEHVGGPRGSECERQSNAPALGCARALS
jgi:hypothetical protein